MRGGQQAYAGNRQTETTGTRRRNVPPDQQVWPPPPRPGAAATQPMPAVHPSSPLPADYSAAAVAAAAQAAGATQAAGEAQDPAAPAAQAPAAEEPPRRRKGRTALVAAIGLVASLAATGAYAFDGYRFREDVISEGLYPKQVTVPAGESYEVYHTEFKATVKEMEPPEGNNHGPDVTWMSIDIRKKVLKEESATMVAEPIDPKLIDRQGRTWVVEYRPPDRPSDRLVVGKEYRIQGVAVVPTAVKDEVELKFRPSNYRSDTPVDDLFKRGTEATRIDNLFELRFKRR